MAERSAITCSPLALAAHFQAVGHYSRTVGDSGTITAIYNCLLRIKLPSDGECHSSPAPRGQRHTRINALYIYFRQLHTPDADILLDLINLPIPISAVHEAPQETFIKDRGIHSVPRFLLPM